MQTSNQLKNVSRDLKQRTETGRVFIFKTDFEFNQDSLGAALRKLPGIEFCSEGNMTRYSVMATIADMFDFELVSDSIKAVLISRAFK